MVDQSKANINVFVIVSNVMEKIKVEGKMSILLGQVALLVKSRMNDSLLFFERTVEHTTGTLHLIPLKQ